MPSTGLQLRRIPGALRRMHTAPGPRRAPRVFASRQMLGCTGVVRTAGAPCGRPLTRSTCCAGRSRQLIPPRTSRRTPLDRPVRRHCTAPPCPASALGRWRLAPPCAACASRPAGLTPRKRTSDGSGAGQPRRAVEQAVDQRAWKMGIACTQEAVRARSSARRDKYKPAAGLDARVAW